MFGVLLSESLGDTIAEGATYGSHLDAVCEAVMDEYGAGEGEDLRLVLESPERSGEDYAVVVALEFGARHLHSRGLAASAARYEEFFPLHLSMVLKDLRWRA